MSQENVEIVRQMFDAYNRGDYDAAAKLAHPDVEMVPPGDQSPYRGRDALRNWMEPNAFSKQTAEAREITAVGDRILVQAHSWLTGASSGIELEVDFWSVWWFDDAGLVTRSEIFLDRKPALEAAGLSE
jgi:ketosteroid isomerase-like protein